ncbi:MAG TPA: pitrilysin family protein [Thermoanaerobaculia bacterium]|nr:pitrilysin family protein [Thermoanaerobaculia bacterium]
MSRTSTKTPLLLAALLALPAVAAAQATRVKELRYPPLTAFDIPRPERVVLDNGMVVLLLEDHELPLIEATAMIRNGSRLDPADKVGLAGIAANVMRTGGTQSMPGDALDDWLESRAASVEVSARRDSVRAVLSSLKPDFPEVLRVFADVLRRPAFDVAKLEVARTQAISDVARQNDDPGDILFRELNKVVYGADSPYARTETFASLNGIGREDLVAWHAGALHPDRVILGVVGDFKRDEVLAQIRQAFGDWKRGPAFQPAEAPYRKEPNPGVFHVAKADVTQSFIAMGHLGVRKDDPDFYALEVLNQILSGSFAARLFSEIRTRKGLAYSVSGGVDSDWDHPSLAYMYVSTKTETTGAGIDALLEEARALEGSRPPTAEEVAKAKQGLVSSFVFTVDSLQEALGRQLTLEYYGYPPDWNAKYRAGIEGVTVEQVRKAARHLRPEEFSILVVGTPEGLDKPLATYGKVTPLDISLPAPPSQGGR